jgi:hypothetical protein
MEEMKAAMLPMIMVPGIDPLPSSMAAILLSSLHGQIPDPESKSKVLGKM